MLKAGLCDLCALTGRKRQRDAYKKLMFTLFPPSQLRAEKAEFERILLTKSFEERKLVESYENRTLNTPPMGEAHLELDLR